MKISPEQVQKVATLARIALSPGEVAAFAEQLSQIVQYVELLDDLQLDDVVPTSHVVDLVCPLRPDEVRPSLPREAVLGQAPAREEEYFLVPRVIE